MKNTLAKCNKDAHLPSLHRSTVELRCNLQAKLHRVTWSLYWYIFKNIDMKLLHVNCVFIAFQQCITLYKQQSLLEMQKSEKYRT